MKIEKSHLTKITNTKTTTIMYLKTIILEKMMIGVMKTKKITLKIGKKKMGIGRKMKLWSLEKKS
jgi:hypothetical protein